MESIKVTVNLPEQAVADLKAMAEEDGLTNTQTLRDAVQLKKYVHDALKAGSTFLLHRPDGTIRELIFKV